MQRRLPALQVETVPGAGHAVQSDRPLDLVRIIEQRAFSWTDLFNRFEETLPADVRIVAVQPQIDKDERMLVAVTVWVQVASE